MNKVSFKISKKGARYHSTAKPNPNPLLVSVSASTTSVFEPHRQQLIPARVQCDNDFARKRSVIDLTEDDDDEDTDDIADADVSFVVNIFPDGYTIDKSLASIDALRIAIMYDPKFLHPYDRASESLFAALECCRVPADFFDDIPCNYNKGKVACEVRDWRRDSSESAGVSINGLTVAATPSTRRISLKMSLDNIVSDITQMSKKDFWAYSKLLEAEAKILLAVYPKLELDPCPNFDRLCKKPTTVKLNLDFCAMRRKRLRQMSVPEKSNLGTNNSKPVMDQPNVVNLAIQSAGQRPAMGQPNSVNLPTQNAGQRPTVRPLTQIVRQIPTMHPLTQTVPQLPTLNKLTQNVCQLPTMHQETQNVLRLPKMDPLTQSTRQLPTMDQLTQNVGQRPGLNVVNLATQNVGQWNTTVSSPINHAPNTSISRFPWESHQPKDQFGVETPGNMRSQTPGTAFNAPGVSSTHSLLNLSSGNGDIDSFMSAFEGGRGNQDNKSFSMANSDHINWSNPLSFAGYPQQKLGSHNALGASSSTPGASFTHAMQSSSSLMSAFDSRRGNQGRQASSIASSNNRIWKDPLLGLPGNHQQMTLENLDNIPGTAFNQLRTSNTPSMSLLSANDGRRSLLSAFDGKTVIQDESSLPRAYLDGRRRSNSLVLLDNQQQQLASNLQNNAARTSLDAVGASSTHGMTNLNSNNGGISSIIPFDGNKGNQHGNWSSLVNMDNSNWSNPLADIVNQHLQIPLHNQNTSGTAFSAAGASSHGMVNLNSNNDDTSSIILFDNASSMANVGYQQPKIEPPMPDNAQGTAFGVSGASPTHSMMDFNFDDIDWSSILSAYDDTIGNQDGQSSIMANADNRNPSNSLAIVGNQQQQISPYMQNNILQTNANVPEASSAQGAMSLSSGDDGIRAIMSGFEGNKCSPMANNADIDRLHPCFPPSHLLQKTLDCRARARFTKIRLLIERYNLINGKELKIDDYKPTIKFCSSQLYPALKGEICNMPLSKSHAGGNVNLCKIRILKFVKEAHSYPAGDEVIHVPRSETKLILSEQCDGTVTMHYCEFDDYDHLSEEALLPSFPNNHSADTFGLELCSLMENEGYTIQGDDIQTKPLSVVQLSDSPVAIAGGNNPVSSIGQDLRVQQRLDFNRTVNNSVSRQQQSQRQQGNMMAPGNVIGTALNIGGENNMVGSPNMSRRDVPCSGRKGVLPLTIINPNPMEKKQGSTSNTTSIPDIKPMATQKRTSVSGRSRGESSNIAGSQVGNSQAPSSRGSGSRGRGSRGRGSRGRGSRGRGSCGRGSRGEGSDNALDNYVNPRERNDVGRLPRTALSKPNVLTESREQSSNVGVVRIANINIDASLILGSGSAGLGSAGSGSHGVLVRNTSGIRKTSDMNRMQRNAMASRRSMSDMNQNNQMQQTNLQPASVSTSVTYGASMSATNQDSSRRSKDWMDEDFIRNMMN